MFYRSPHLPRHGSIILFSNNIQTAALEAIVLYNFKSLVAGSTRSDTQHGASSWFSNYIGNHLLCFLVGLSLTGTRKVFLFVFRLSSSYHSSRPGISNICFLLIDLFLFMRAFRGYTSCFRYLLGKKEWGVMNSAFPLLSFLLFALFLPGADRFDISLRVPLTVDVFKTWHGV